MGKIVISTNSTLDGVVQDPDGQDGFSRGGWFNGLTDNDREAWAKVFSDEAMTAGALLLGRRSDAWFAGRWESREGAWADKLNRVPKYVVSSTLDKTAWSNGTVLGGDPVTEVARLRDTVPGDILLYGSAQLAHTLLAHGLVDEIRLLVFPTLLGAGTRLFPETPAEHRLRLTGTRRVGDSLLLVTYEAVREA